MLLQSDILTIKCQSWKLILFINADVSKKETQSVTKKAKGTI